MSDLLTSEHALKNPSCRRANLDLLKAKYLRAAEAWTIVEAGKPERRGWMLSNIHDEFQKEEAEERPYPFRHDVGRLLPWWDQAEEAKAERKLAT